MESGDRAQPVAVIDVSHLQKRYGSVIAVEDVTITVAADEISGLVRPNGFGKTTTVESHRRLADPRRWLAVRTFRWEREDRLPRLRRPVGVLFTFP